MVTRQFSTYILVGIVCAVIDVGLMQLLIFLGMHYMAATTIGFVTGLLINFLLHTQITFNTRYSHHALLCYLVVVGANYLLTLLVVELFHHWLEMAILGKLISLPLIAINGFLLGKNWIYAAAK